MERDEYDGDLLLEASDLLLEASDLLLEASDLLLEASDLLLEAGDLLLCLVPSKLAVHIASTKHGDLRLIFSSNNFYWKI